MRTLDVGWETCAASPKCTGSARRPYGRCLAHLGRTELDEVVAGLSPGSAIDLRATAVGGELLERILTATRGHLGRTRFDWATFPESVRFGDIAFSGDVSFDHAHFHQLASLPNARFARNVSFREARFDRELSLHGATISGHVAFDQVSIDGDALFGEALFHRTASFENADFHGFVAFDGTGFTGDASLRGCRFRRAVSFRKASFGGRAGFDGARFSSGGYLAPISVGRHLTLAGAWAGKELDVTTAGCSVDLRRLEVGGRLTVRLDDARADLEGATLHGPATVRGRDGARVVSLRGVDAEELELTGLDLRTCLLGGLRHPDGLRLSDCALAVASRGRRGLRWWPPRRTPKRD